MDHETGRTIRYVVKVLSIAAGVALCFGFAGLFAWLIVRDVVAKDHWWEIIPMIAVPVLVGPGGALAWLWFAFRRKMQRYEGDDVDGNDVDGNPSGGAE